MFLVYKTNTQMNKPILIVIDKATKYKNDYIEFKSH